jgi:hypothetical protein
MPRTQLVLLGCFPLPDKITQRLGVFIGNPHCRQISGTMTACQLQRIPAVRLHAVSGLLRYQTRRHNRALDTQLRQLPVQYESCRPCFITGPQLFRRTKLLDELADRIFTVADRAQGAYLAIRPGCTRGGFLPVTTSIASSSVSMVWNPSSREPRSKSVLAILEKAWGGQADCPSTYALQVASRSRIDRAAEMQSGSAVCGTGEADGVQREGLLEFSRTTWCASSWFDQPDQILRTAPRKNRGVLDRSWNPSLFHAL